LRSKTRRITNCCGGPYRNSKKNCWWLWSPTMIPNPFLRIFKWNTVLVPHLP